MGASFRAQSDKKVSMQNNNVQAAKDRIINAISDDPDLPAFGNSISRIIRLSSSDDESIRQLTYFILSDVSLTQKTLRLANSATYRAASGSGKPITSITKAVFLLGFNTVKASALTVILVDGMSGKTANNVRIELNHALAASMVGRELAKFSHFNESEEIVVTTLFKNIGRLLIAAYDPDLYTKLIHLIEKQALTPAQASIELLGCSLDTFTKTVLQKWDIPASIIKGLEAPHSGNLKVPQTRQEWMQQAGEFSQNAARLILKTGGIEEFALETELLSRFGKSLNLNKTKLDELLADAIDGMNALCEDQKLSYSGFVKANQETVADTKEAISEQDILNDLICHGGNLATPDIQKYYPSGKPYHAHALLLSGVQDVLEILMSDHYKISDLIMMVLETLYNGLGFRFATLCLKDIKTNCFRARSSLGVNNTDIQQGFVFRIQPSNNLFHLAMEKNVDLLILDASTYKVRELIPSWHAELLSDAASFIILPLVVKENPIGLFYADRTQAAPEGISAEEMELIRTLKNQVLAALNPK